MISSWALAQSDLRARRRLGAISNTIARSYLLELGYFHGIRLPEYYVPSGFPAMNLTDSPSKIETIPLELYAPKGLYSWRRFSLLHPYAYWHLVHCMTRAEAWAMIKDALTSPTRVACYSLPDLRPRRAPAANGIRGWLSFERDVRTASPDFTHLAVCDIGSFYPSVYTHSIAWALHGRETAQRERGRQNRIGDQIDTIFRKARRGQTNGLPIGNVASDIVAEVILHDIDRLLGEELSDRLAIARYRDDYRILAPSEADAKRALRLVSRVLHEHYDLTLNSEKTHIYSDVIAGATRPWTTAMRSNAALSSLVLQGAPAALTGSALLAILHAAYSVQREFPEGSPAVSILSKLAQVSSLGGKCRPAQLREAIAILRQLMSLRESVTPVAARVVDMLLDHLGAGEARAILADLVAAALRGADNTFELVWIFRLVVHHWPEWLDQFRAVANPLLTLALDPEVPTIQVFSETTGLSAHDRRELARFSLVDHRVLSGLHRTPIPQSAVNVFAYPPT